MKKNHNQHISLLALVMLITGAIDSIRNLPPTALFGEALPFFFLFAALFFLLPTALISSELSCRLPEQGGIFNWVRTAFGDKVGFMAIWLQWINTVVWYPTILSFIAGILAYLIDPSLAQNKLYLISVILITFWLMTWLNMRGLETSARFASFCAIAGMLIPMVLIVGLAGYWLYGDHTAQIQLHWNNFIPNFSHTQSWISLTAIVTSFLGMELSTVHVKNIANAQRIFPKAILISVALITATMLSGSLSIAAILPAKDIQLVDGIMQVFTNLFNAYHLNFCIPIIAILLLVGSLGSLVNWIISPAKGLQQAGNLGFLPRALARENEYGVANKVLILQGVLVSLFCLAFLLMPSVNGSYWLLSALSTELYMFMYVLMFIAGLVIRFKDIHPRCEYKNPGGKIGFCLITLCGLIGCIITIIIGFFPPADIDVGGSSHYIWVFSLGLVGLIVPTLGFYAYQKTNK